MNLKIIFLTLLISDCSFGVSLLDSADVFEDLFSEFDSSSWRKDYGKRHCGISPTPGGCVWNQNDNLRYVHQDSTNSDYWKSNELRISVKNDCEGKHCCNHDSCTSYTSGQLSSKNVFGYGSYSFIMKLSKEVKTFDVKSTSFKSVYCAQSPSSDLFPSFLRRASTAGYCEVDNADLERFSSNRDLCRSTSVEASERNICARYTWVIDNFGPSTFRFKANGKGIDYVNAAVYVGDEFVVEGRRNLIQDFEINLETTGMHKVELFAFEDCCAGSHKQGYNGWTMHRQTHSSSPVYSSPSDSDGSDGEMPAEYSGGRLVDPSNNEGSNVGGESSDAIGVENIAGINLGDSPLPETTQESLTFTTEELIDTTAELPCSEPHCSQDVTPCDPREDVSCAGPSSSSDVGGPSYSGMPGYSGACPIQCMILTTSAAATAGEASGVAMYDLNAQGEVDCSSCSDDEEGEDESHIRSYFLEMIDMLEEQVGVIYSMCQSPDVSGSKVKANLHILAATALMIDDSLIVVLEQEVLQNSPQSGTLLATIREIQTMVQDALNRCQRSQNETGALPAQILQDLLSVYESLLHVEGMLEPRAASDDEGADNDAQFGDTTTEYPGFSSSSTPGFNDAMESDDEMPPQEDAYMFGGHSTTHHVGTPPPDPDGDSVMEALGFGALHCFILQRYQKNRDTLKKIGMCLMNFNSRRALIFAGVGQKMFRQIVALPFDAAKMIGRYRIDWQPTGITWNADNQVIGSITAKQSLIPDGLLRMKFYAAPINPTKAPRDFLIEQTMQIFAVQYKNYVIKDELRLAVEPQDKRYIYSPIGGLLLFALGCGIILRWKRKTQPPAGYTVLAEREEMI